MDSDAVGVLGRVRGSDVRAWRAAWRTRTGRPPPGSVSAGT